MPLVLLLLAGGLLYGQLITSSMVGRITDQSGAAVPDTIVSVKNLDKGTEISVKTDPSGNYSALNLLPGAYQVTARKTGFRDYRVTGIQLAAQQTVRQDVQLQVGAVEQTIEVQGSAPLLRTDSASVGASISARQIEDLPTSMASIDSLLYLVPGAQNSAIEHPQTSGAGYWGGTYFTLNGVSENDFNSGRGTDSILGLENQPPRSALQEFKVESVNAGAEYREVNTVMLVTKSGTNKFHSESYEYLQNTVLNANDFLMNAAGQPRAPQHWNQFGTNLGGPILKDKAFFFVNYSGFRRNVYQATSFNFPSMAMRQGDFSTLCSAYSNGVCADPTGTQLYNPQTGQPFANNKIPTSMITSQAQALLKYLPAPTTAGTSGIPYGSPNYIGTVPLAYNRDMIDARFDYQLTSNDNMYVVYSRNTSGKANMYLGGPATYGNADNYGDDAFNYSAGYTHVFTPQTFNELRLGYSSMRSTRKGMNQDFNPRTLFPQLTASPNRGLPAMNMSGYSGMFNDAGGTSSITQIPTVNLTEAITHVRGHHTIKAGAEVSLNKIYSPNTDAPLGTFNFNGQWTGNIGQPGQPQSQGNAFADFLLGDATSSSTGIPGIEIPVWGTTSEYYVQDTWQAAPRLTLTFGVRYMYQTPWNFQGNYRSGFDTNTGKLLIPQDSDTPTCCIPGMDRTMFAAYPIETTHSVGLPLQYVQPDKNDWSPRVGFAWRPTLLSKYATALRGGYGIYYNIIPSAMARVEGSNPPWSTGTSSMNYISQLPGTVTSTYLPDITFANPFPTGSGQTAAAASTPAIYYTPHDLKNSRAQQWNVTLEQELAKNWMGRITYVGSYTQHILAFLSDINIPAKMTPRVTRQSQRPYQPFSNVYASLGDGYQNFNQLQLELNKHFSSGFLVQVQYQWTRSLDDAPILWGVQNPHYPDLDYGNSDSIRRHFLVTNWVWELPFGKGRHWLNSMPGVAEQILGGWQVSGWNVYGTGQPFSTSFNQPNGYTGWYAGRPDAVAGASLYQGQQRGSHDVINGVKWFNPAAFNVPLPWTWGNAQRNGVFGPGYWDWDMSLSKSFYMPKLEGHKLQVRGDFLNAFNHFNLGNPNGTIAATQYGGSAIPSSGVIYGGSGKRTIQLGLRYLF